LDNLIKIHKLGLYKLGDSIAICSPYFAKANRTLGHFNKFLFFNSIQDYMFEESVCLLLRASWFMTLTVEDHEDVYEDPEDYYPYEFEDEDDDDLDEVYLSSSSNLRIGNRRWGDNGYVRAGHQEARPVYQADFKDMGACTSREPKKKEAAKDRTGRRAKRTLKREAADKAAASKHQQHLARLGRK
jgi:hypothetical protein